MDEEQKEKFRKQLESYKKELGLDNKKVTKPIKPIVDDKKIPEKKPLRFNKSIDFEKGISSIKEKASDNLEKNKLNVESNLDKKPEVSKENIIKEITKVSSENPVSETVKTVEKQIEKKEIKQIISTENKDTKKEVERNDKTEAIKVVPKTTMKTEPKIEVTHKKETVKIEPKPIVKTEVKTAPIQKEVIVKEPVKKVVEVKNESSFDLPKAKVIAVIPEKKVLSEAQTTKYIQDNLIAKNLVDDKKNSKAPLLLIPLLIILIVGLAYYFYNNPSDENELESIAEQNKLIEERAAFVADSILLYESALAAEQEEYVDEEYTEENEYIEEALEVAYLSDSIFNISSDNPEGYYVVIGGYGDLKNAKKLRDSNPTIFEGHIFEGKVKRVALLVGNDDDEAIENLDIIKFKYADAWLMYNVNEY